MRAPRRALRVRWSRFAPVSRRFAVRADPLVVPAVSGDRQQHDRGTARKRSADIRGKSAKIRDQGSVLSPDRAWVSHADVACNYMIAELRGERINEKISEDPRSGDHTIPPRLGDDAGEQRHE